MTRKRRRKNNNRIIPILIVLVILIFLTPKMTSLAKYVYNAVKNIIEINLLASNHGFPSRRYEFTNNIIVADRRKYNILNLIKNEIIVW